MPPADLALVLVTPSLKLPERKTEYTRSVLPKMIGLKMMVSNVANASMIVSGFARGEIEMIGAGMEDRVVEEARKKMIPGYDSVKRHGDRGRGGRGLHKRRRTVHAGRR